jgi:hypothetical protein
MARSDPSVFRGRLDESCKSRGTTVSKLLRSIGIGPKRAIAVENSGLRELDIYRLLQTADTLDVSVDWLTGRSAKRDL